MWNVRRRREAEETDDAPEDETVSERASERASECVRR